MSTEITYYPKEQVTVITEGLGSDNHISNSREAIRMLERCNIQGFLLGDKGFGYEKLYKEQEL